VILVLACIGAATALMKVKHTLASVPVVDVASALAAEPAKSNEPRNFLIIGTDSAAGLAKGDPVLKGREVGYQLADVIMILRVDPRDASARLLSIPRDSRLALAPDGHMERINAAIAGAQGPRNLVQTIKRNFGIPIDNYVEIDFESFRDLVDVLGGVPVYFTTPVRDRNTGLAVYDAGCKMLDPVQALAYARSRHFEFQDEKGKWRTDGTGDLGRITRQQDFIKRSLRRASEKGIRNPSTAVGLVDAAASAVKLDDTLTVGSILDLLGAFRSFNPDALRTDQIPTFSAPRGGVSYQDIDWDAAEPLVDPFRGIAPGQPIAPKAVIVDVTGPTAKSAQLTAMTQALDTAGFDAETLETRSGASATTINYGPKGRDAAILLARQLDTIPKLVEDDEITGYRVVLNVGKTAPQVRPDLLPVDQLPPELRAAPSTTATIPQDAQTNADPNDAVTTTAPSTTTLVPGADAENPIPADAPPGVVPTDPEKAAACH